MTGGWLWFGIHGVPNAVLEDRMGEAEQVTFLVSTLCHISHALSQLDFRKLKEILILSLKVMFRDKRFSHLEEHQDGRVVGVRERASQRVIIQMLEYSYMRKIRRREVSLLDPARIWHELNLTEILKRQTSMKKK